MRLSKVLTATAFAGVMALAGNSWAASVSSQLFHNQQNKASDNSGESLGVGFTSNKTTTPLLWTGATLRGTLQIGTVEDLTGGGGVNTLGSGSVNELSAIFEIEVGSATVDLSTDTDGSCAGDSTCNNGLNLTGDERADYTFTPHAAFATDFGLTTGTMVAFFEDPTPDYDRTKSTQAAIEADATNGTLAWELGFFGDADEGWGALGAPVDPSVGKNAATGGVLGFFNVQLSIGLNNLFTLGSQVGASCIFLPCPGDGLIDVNGSGSILGTKGSTTFYDVFDNVDLVFQPLPEPGTLALFGFGLLFLGFATRRRRRHTAA